MSFKLLFEALSRGSRAVAISGRMNEYLKTLQGDSQAPMTLLFKGMRSRDPHQLAKDLFRDGLGHGQTDRKMHRVDVHNYVYGNYIPGIADRSDYPITSTTISELKASRFALPRGALLVIPAYNKDLQFLHDLIPSEFEEGGIDAPDYKTELEVGLKHPVSPEIIMSVVPFYAGLKGEPIFNPNFDISAAAELRIMGENDIIENEKAQEKPSSGPGMR